MKTKYSVLGSTLLLCTTVLTVGCSSSGGGSGSSGGTASTATTIVSGTTGAGASGATPDSSAFKSQIAVINSTDTVAVLRVDKNGDGLLDASDLIYTIPVLSDGSFSFDNVLVDATKPTKAQLSVAKEGYAPVVKTVTLQKDTPLSIFADVSNTPVLTQVVKLPETAAKRANTFLKFGITSDENGLSSFSKLMTLSELKADADLGEGTLTTASIPTAAFDAKVKSVTVQMQAFDSTKAADIEHFPGAFSGHGKPTLGTTATGDESEGALESAAFDLIKLTDQNGENIELNMTPDKLAGSTAGASTCSGMYWVRHVTSDQAVVINAWGDDDKDASNGFQVPIWSNDNATGTWAYVGEALWKSDDSQFEICVDKKWQGYLNCDSLINVGGKPKELCIYAYDQFDKVIDNGLTFRAKKGNSYSSGYLYQGRTGLDLATGTPSNWQVTYSGAWTGWTKVGLDTSTAGVSTTQGCDYDLNVTVDNPYSAQVYVYVYDDNNVSVKDGYVNLQSSAYRHYYSQGAHINAKGYAAFSVEPNVTYTAFYKGASADVNVNGHKDSPETSDEGGLAAVRLEDVNVAPTVSMGMPYKIKDTAQTVPFYISARDRNMDTLSLVSFTSKGTTLVEGVDYNITSTNSYSGNLYVRGILDLNSTTLQGLTPSLLQAGSYTFTAEVSDGKVSSQASTTLLVAANTAPVIDAMYLVNGSYNYYYKNYAIPQGDYTVNYYVYDLDGDSFTKTMTLDDAAYTPGDVKKLLQGDHNVTISASDDGGLTSTKETHFYVGNHAPVINSAGATSYLIDVKSSANSFKLYAYVTDAENDTLSVSALDDANVTHTLARVGNYGSKYVSDSITLSDVNITDKKVPNHYNIIANDGESNSTAAVVTVESYATNQPPLFTTALIDQQVNVNEAQEFTCVAEDPEGTDITYSWKLNGEELSENGTTFNKTFTTTGVNTLSCIATDENDKSATSRARITVIDPSESGTLTVHAKYKGLLVSLHDTNLKVTTKKFTDDNGDAVFENLTGGRTTFSITAWPGMEIYKDLTMDMIKPQIIYEAQGACDNNTSTECTTADWCALMSASSIPTWVWDAKIDDGGDKPAAASVDTNSDGSISQDELYTAALGKFDADSDGHLSYDELLQGIGSSDTKYTIEDIYANVPVRAYYITLDVLDQFHGGYYYEQAGGCQGGTAFNSQLSIDYSSLVTPTATSSSANKDVSVEASGNGYLYNQPLDENNTVSVPVQTYYPGKNGKYTYLVKERDHGAYEYNFYLLTDKTKAEMDANITLNAADFKVADKNVSFVNSDTNYVSLFPSYQGIELWSTQVYVDDKDGNYQTYTRKYFTYSGIYYALVTNGSQHDNDYNSYNYYGDGTLQNSYDASNYPSLDAVFTLNSTDNTWTLAGSDMSKLNDVGAYFNAGVNKDENGTTITHNFNLSTYWTVAPSQSPQMVLKDIVPSEAFADANASIDESNGYSDFGVDAEEFKGLSESAFIDAFAGSSTTSQNGEQLYDNGSRGIRAGSAGSEYSSAAAEESKKTHSRSSMFRLRLNPSSK